MTTYRGLESDRRFRLLSEKAHRPDPVARACDTKAATKREKARVAAAKREIAEARQALVEWYWDCVERGQNLPPGLQLEIDWLKRLGQGERSFARLLSNPEGRPPNANEEHEIRVATAAFIREKQAGLSRIEAIAVTAAEYDHPEATVRNWYEKHQPLLAANAGWLECQKEPGGEGATG